MESWFQNNSAKTFLDFYSLVDICDFFFSINIVCQIYIKLNVNWSKFAYFYHDTLMYLPLCFAAGVIFECISGILRDIPNIFWFMSLVDQVHLFK